LIVVLFRQVISGKSDGIAKQAEASFLYTENLFRRHRIFRGFVVWPAAFEFMVYSKDVYIKIVVVVNADTFLWISAHSGLKSAVYGLHKQASKPCMSKELFWDKKIGIP